LSGIFISTGIEELFRNKRDEAGFFHSCRFPNNCCGIIPEILTFPDRKERLQRLTGMPVPGMQFLFRLLRAFQNLLSGLKMIILLSDFASGGPDTETDYFQQIDYQQYSDYPACRHDQHLYDHLSA
jgi:hypothetical protein